MARGRKIYTKEFEEHIVCLARSGQKVSDLAREFKLSRTTVTKWIAQADARDGLVTEGAVLSNSEEINRLKREVVRLKRERDILAKAAAWFARETISMPNRSSNS